MANCRMSTHSDGDSDSDWDDDDDFASKKITIKIKPIAQATQNKISASVDELRATVGTWKSLANINLVKPNSRRHNNNSSAANYIHQQNQLLDHTALQLEQTKIPVAFAIQECLNANLYNSDNRSSIVDTLSLNNSNGICNMTNMVANGLSVSQQFINTNQVSLIGHLKMAAPPELATIDSTTIDQNLEIELISSIPWDLIRLNEQFVSELINNNHQNNDLRNTSGSSCSSNGATTPVNNYSLSSNPLKAQLPNRPTMNVYHNNTQQQHNKSHHPFVSSSSSSSLSSSTTNHQLGSKRLLIKMDSVCAHVKQQYQKQPNQKYYLVPELLKYFIGSQYQQNNNNNDNLRSNNSNNDIDIKRLSSSSQSSIIRTLSSSQDTSARLSPLQAQAHWLCDLTITKVRLDLQFLENTIDNFGLSNNDLTNLKISFYVDGGVTSYQSKPEANWDSINSKLTWHFGSLNELMQKSNSNGMVSCLAKLNLSDGPSSPSDVNIEFSIEGKTLTGTQIILNGTNYRIAKQKYEVKTGAFKCKSPCI